MAPMIILLFIYIFYLYLYHKRKEVILMDIIEEYKHLLDGFLGGDMDIYDQAVDLYDDSESFMTSKEIVENKEKLEKQGVSINIPIESPDIEEEVHFKRYTKKKAHKYTEAEMTAIRESCVATIVHDYGEHDIYHMSDEERRKNDMLADLSMKLAGVKRAYRRVDQYVEAMRIVVEAWELLEKNNYVHTKDEFFEMVAEGTIVSNRIIMPKLKKADQYNMDTIIKYISNPELDASDLMPKTEKVRDCWYDQFDDIDEETADEMTQRLLSPEEVQYILDHDDNPEELVTKDIKRKYIKGYDNRNQIISRRNSDKKKKINKNEKEIIQDTHDILNKIQSNPANRMNEDCSRSYMLTHSMFEIPKKEKSMWDDLYFTGSWTNKNDLFLYDLITEEERLKQHPPREVYVTYGDKELSNFFRIMEANGVSTLELQRRMNATPEDIKTTEAKQIKKENKKIESELIQRITKLNNSPKFKKIVAKAEKALNKPYED